MTMRKLIEYVSRYGDCKDHHKIKGTEMTEPKWRSDPVTNKQMNYIMELYEHDEFRRIPKFTGTTKGEASDFIDKYAHFAYESFDNEYHDSNYGDRI